MDENSEGPGARRIVLPYLHGRAEQEEGQVEEGEAGQQVVLLGHGASMLLLLTVHHHHVDHEAHDRQAEDEAEQKGVPPPGRAKMCRVTERRHEKYSFILLLTLL